MDKILEEKNEKKEKTIQAGGLVACGWQSVLHLDESYRLSPE